MSVNGGGFGGLVAPEKELECSISWVSGETSHFLLEAGDTRVVNDQDVAS